MSFVYTPAKRRLFEAGFDLREAGSDIRLILVMTNTTADTFQDTEFVSGVTLDEYDGTGYARKALASQAVNQDDPNNRAEFDADDVLWSILGAGSRPCQGMVLYKHVTNDGDSPLIAFIDTGGFPFSGSGIDIQVTWNTEGIVQAT